ncbi:MAG: FapA family protein [Spirochaetales bacterium]
MAEEGSEVFLTIGGDEGGARVDVFVAPDGMKCWGVFSPPTEAEGKLLVFSDIVDALQNGGITHGLQDRAVQEAIFHCNMEKMRLPEVPLAIGTTMLKERPAFLKLETHIYSHHFDKEKAVQVDFKEYTPFVIVKKGELLARAVLPQGGRQGTTVFGVEIPAGKKEIKMLKPGPNTFFAHGKVFARLAGRFVLENENFDVSDLLEIAGGVDYSTGNLVFPGSIIVKGVVQDGFKIVAGGSITVHETLDASEVMCRTDLSCNGGIIGKKPGLVRVGGNVKALFVENCQMDVLGNAHFSKSLLHTRLSVNGNLTFDDGGRIVSSSITVKGNLFCTQLGNENGPCHVIAGTDFVVLRKMEGIRAKYKDVEEELFKLKARLAELGKEKFADAEKDLKKAMETLVSEMNQLTPQLFNPQETSVRVSGLVHEGTVIEMGYARLQIDDKIKGKTFRLSPDQKSILVEKFEKVEKA